MGLSRRLSKLRPCRLSKLRPRRLSKLRPRRLSILVPRCFSIFRSRLNILPPRRLSKLRQRLAVVLLKLPVEVLDEILILLLCRFRLKLGSSPFGSLQFVFVDANSQACILPGVCSLYEGQHAPAGNHACSAGGNKWEGNAGQRQQVHGTEHVQNSLEHEQGCCGTGCYAVICGTAGNNRTVSENPQSNDAKHCQYGNNKAPFLSQKTEDQVGA